MKDKLEAKKIFKYLLNSFPKKLSNEVVTVFEIIPYNEKVISIFDGKSEIKNSVYSDEKSRINVNIDSENIKIPYRIYFNEPENTKSLNSIQRDILACVYSRHYNGFIRQKYMEKIIDNENYWITPFFIQLFGEYVYEMLAVFDKYLDRNIENCIKFINENKEYWEYTKSRMISYWNEFYREKYPCFNKYAGKKIIGKINREKNNKVRRYFV